MMLVHVREHLADPRLQVGDLARRHHVSVSYVYTLFGRIGTTPAAYLREQRLRAAQAMLSDPRHAWLATSDIAAAVGFCERRTFDRAFQRQYGMTPSSWRREQCDAGCPTTRERPLRDGRCGEPGSRSGRQSLTDLHVRCFSTESREPFRARPGARPASSRAEEWLDRQGTR
jgi:AraC-like DNA-binding protein